MDTWEYREAIHDDYTTSLTDALNVEGAMGWELVGAMPRYYREPGHTFGRNVLRLVFKRKLPDKLPWPGSSKVAEGS